MLIPNVRAKYIHPVTTLLSTARPGTVFLNLYTHHVRNTNDPTIQNGDHTNAFGQLINN